MKPYDVDASVWFTVMANDEDHAFDILNNLFRPIMRGIERGEEKTFLDVDWVMDSIGESEDWNEEGNPA